MLSESVKKKIEEAAIKTRTEDKYFYAKRFWTTSQVMDTSFEAGAQFGYALASDENARLKEKLEKIEKVFLKIQELGCLYRGNLTGCAGCIICNEFPEYKIMNDRERGGYENN